MQKPPRLTIGLPVYNAERYLRFAVDSVLAQSFQDFALVISDNASTDATQAICTAYARQDPRIRYYRSPVNRGLSWNHSRVFALSEGSTYFQWLHHDDILAPQMSEQCVAALDADPEAVLCYPGCWRIDARGDSLGPEADHSRSDSPSVQVRFHDLLLDEDHLHIQQFGAMRREVLARTPLIGAYAHSDRVLLAHLGVQGRFLKLPECLFFKRIDAQNAAHFLKNAHLLSLWLDPGRGERVVLPTWELLGGYLGAIKQAPPSARLAC